MALTIAHGPACHVWRGTHAGDLNGESSGRDLLQWPRGVRLTLSRGVSREGGSAGGSAPQKYQGHVGSERSEAERTAHHHRPKYLLRPPPPHSPPQPKTKILKPDHPRKYPFHLAPFSHCRAEQRPEQKPRIAAPQLPKPYLPRGSGGDCRLVSLDFFSSSPPPLYSHSDLFLLVLLLLIGLFLFSVCTVVPSGFGIGSQCKKDHNSQSIVWFSGDEIFVDPLDGMRVARVLICCPALETGAMRRM
ncbi:hypothetical protein Taro_007950 [Colocasia esculenta]|uniref:Uncharacterized protein n=1 Tax=Colocasia esculenta TaxID=4460 RepID=A0A843U5H3_COLES|nr:hypothetical protein [Colocasia esculenta]